LAYLAVGLLVLWGVNRGYSKNFLSLCFRKTTVDAMRKYKIKPILTWRLESNEEKK
jgi:hypothetical protein